MRTLLILGTLALGALALPTLAAELPGDVQPVQAPEITWPEGPGQTILQQKCLFCHSGEYITIQRLKLDGWKSEVKKMVKFGSPLTHAEEETLAKYLAEHYGPDKPLSAPPRITPVPVAPASP